MRFSFSGNPVSNPCGDTFPEQATSCCLPKPACCDPCCPPLVSLRDFVLVKPATTESCFLIGAAHCTEAVVHAAQHCIEMVIRKRGDCRALLRLRPLRATLEGAACFAWPRDWWMLKDGLFEGDIHVNGHHCLTVGLRMAGCQQALLSYSSTEGLPCGYPMPACVTPLDDGPLPPSAPCESPSC